MRDYSGKLDGIDGKSKIYGVQRKCAKI